ncbi:hypothetical protein ACFO1B_02310 [Dactylosporangium siamense]|uniref:Uncharacterized protein n=1 Tax=Dactylosporangium siamense TaxID=685454 RepID=A0A919PSE6_9ACTN|nr:hypothetical protein [Dactylosporangium siamense]GIG48501.1 hypothetical protein Dsi01nite_065420 [Dactylosporangium siamense]
MIVEAVLDTGAVMAYVNGVDRVGELLFRAAEDRFGVAVPSTCLLEAYQAMHVEDFDMLRLLRLLPIVLIDEPQTDVSGADDLPIIGGMAARAGRIGAGHAALTAATHSAAVFTSLPAQIESVLGKSWPIVEV